jgi:hypothetical protein
MSVIVHRKAARAILLTPEREVLLMRIPAGRRRSILDYARRRYRGQRKPGARFQTEEGRDWIRRCRSGPVLWRRQHTFNFRNKRCCQSEQYLVVHASRFHPQINDAEEAMVLDRISLVETVHDDLREGAPIELPDVEVLID